MQHAKKQENVTYSQEKQGSQNALSLNFLDNDFKAVILWSKIKGEYVQRIKGNIVLMNR